MNELIIETDKYRATVGNLEAPIVKYKAHWYITVADLARLEDIDPADRNRFIDRFRKWDSNKINSPLRYYDLLQPLLLGSDRWVRVHGWSEIRSSILPKEPKE